jgi:hypothetical protein
MGYGDSEGEDLFSFGAGNAQDMRRLADKEDHGDGAFVDATDEADGGGGISVGNIDGPEQANRNEDEEETVSSMFRFVEPTKPSPLYLPILTAVEGEDVTAKEQRLRR